MAIRILVSVLGVFLLLSGCTATEQGAGIGAATGAGLGAIIGHQSKEAGPGAAIGAAAGALVGGLIGHEVEKDQQKKEVESAYQQGRQDSSGSSVSSSSSGKGTWVEGHYEYVTKKEWVDTTTRERVWVEEQVIGDKRIEGHWVERDVPSGYWRSYEEKTWIPGHFE